MVIPYLDQRGKDVVPGLLFHHDFIGEHAAIPTDVLEGLGQFSLLVTEPEACMFGDIQFAIRIQCLAMAAGFVV